MTAGARASSLARVRPVRPFGAGYFLEPVYEKTGLDRGVSCAADRSLRAHNTQPDRPCMLLLERGGQDTHPPRPRSHKHGVWALLLGAWARDGSTLVTTSNDRRDGLDGWSAGEWSCLRTLTVRRGAQGLWSDASVRVGFGQLYPRHVPRRDTTGRQVHVQRAQLEVPTRPHFPRG